MAITHGLNLTSDDTFCDCEWFAPPLIQCCMGFRKNFIQENYQIVYALNIGYGGGSGNERGDLRLSLV